MLPVSPALKPYSKRVLEPKATFGSPAMSQITRPEHLGHPILHPQLPWSKVIPKCCQGSVQAAAQAVLHQGWKLLTCPSPNLSPEVPGEEVEANQQCCAQRLLCSFAVDGRDVQTEAHKVLPEIGGISGQAEMLYSFFHMIMSRSPAALEATCSVFLFYITGFYKQSTSGQCSCIYQSSIANLSFMTHVGWNSLGLVGLFLQGIQSCVQVCNDSFKMHHCVLAPGTPMSKSYLRLKDSMSPVLLPGRVQRPFRMQTSRL